MEKRRASRRNLVCGMTVCLAAFTAVGAAGANASSGGGSGSAQSISPKGTPSASTLTQLRNILKLPTGKAAGKGLKIKLGASFTFSGSEAAYAPANMMGATLAIQEIKALGGPDFELTPIDDGGIDTQKGSQVARQFGLSGDPIILTRGGGDLGSELPAAKQYKLTEFDVNTSENPLYGTPYYYMMSSETVTGPAKGMAEFLKAKGVKSVAFVSVSGLGDLDSFWQNWCTNAIKGAGLNLVGTISAPLTATDYTQQVQQILQLKPQAVYETVVGNGGAVLSKELRQLGYKGIIIGADYSAVEAKIAGSAWSNYYVGYDYFPYGNPTNPWSKIFVDESKRAFGDAQPDKFYASTYDTMFVIWSLVRKIIAQGGNPAKQGDAYVNAFDAETKFPSVWGGTSTSVGYSTYSAKTHALVGRTLSIAKANVNANGIGSPEQVATFDNLTGAAFKTVS